MTNWYDKLRWQPPTKEKDGYHCPKCGAKLTLRTNKRDMSSFLGCTRYPYTCDYTCPSTEREINAKWEKEQEQWDKFMLELGVNS